MGGGASHRQGDLANHARRVKYEEKGTAPLSPKTLQRKLRRLMKEFAKAGINPQDVMAQAVATQG